MAIQSVFKRYELKYMITKDQKNAVLAALEPYMKLDKYGRTTIQNLYFDTDSYLLIRRSIEKPTYKEKLRIRSYGVALPESKVFVELKKKYKSVVYKRRVTLPYKDAIDWLCNNETNRKKSQISNEIDYFLDYYKTLHPTVFLSYEREAYYSCDGSDFRVTFDENILARTDGLDLTTSANGFEIPPSGMTLMEIKCSGGIPLWLTHTLSEQKIYKTPFSKYGTAYKTLIFPTLQQKGE